MQSDDSCTSQLQSLAEDLQVAGVEGQTGGNLRSSGEGGTDGKDLLVCTCMCGSAHDCGCMVNGYGSLQRKGCTSKLAYHILLSIQS